VTGLGVSVASSTLAVPVSVTVWPPTSCTTMENGELAVSSLKTCVPVKLKPPGTPEIVCNVPVEVTPAPQVIVAVKSLAAFWCW